MVTQVPTNLDDTLIYSNTSVTVDALGGDDSISTGSGADTLKGGLGNDTYVFNLGDGHDILWGNSKSRQHNIVNNRNNLENYKGVA
ncbi:MAG: hypothetical protein JKY28_05460 [Sulfurimonas sp.]|nr:hypothetical protein [Sulfurimonas sp.]PHQ88366.1 MAG: hypothetical protein COB42_08980 [Sulfurimonas sp.]